MDSGSEQDRDQRLEQLIVERLEAGQDRESLLWELKTRLDADRAEALMASATKRAGPPVQAEKERPFTGPEKAILAGACLWAGMLVLQNFAVLAAAKDAATSALNDGYPAGESIGLHLFAVFKIVLLAISATFLFLTKLRVRLLLFAIAILYAFPFGGILEGALLRGLPRADPATLLNLSALLSYGSAAGLAFLWWKLRKAPDPDEAAEPFV